MIWHKTVGYVSWFLVSRLAILGICVGIPLGIGWFLGWLSS